MLTRFLPKSVTASLIMLLSLSLLIIPFMTNTMQAQAQDAATACLDAERQATSDVNSTTWLAIGCLTGVIGYLIAMQESNPPATQLLGKSPEYVAAYTDCYRKKTKQIKTKNALTGCLVATAAYVVYMVVLISAVEDAATTDY